MRLITTAQTGEYKNQGQSREGWGWGWEWGALKWRQRQVMFHGMCSCSPLQPHIFFQSLSLLLAADGGIA